MNMNPITPISQQLSQAIDSLPEDALLELANFLEYLRLKFINSSVNQEQDKNDCLQAIASLGKRNETGLSERGEEFLTQEIEQIKEFSDNQRKRDNYRRQVLQEIVNISEELGLYDDN